MQGKRRQFATDTPWTTNKYRLAYSLFVAFLVIFALPRRSLAQGGPPLITDDPDTPGPGYWEINLASIVEKSSSLQHLEGPAADINYGVGERIQLKFEIPWVNVNEKGQAVQNGVGNGIAGVKWRFLGQENQRLAWSVYPQLQINTGRSLANRGLIDKGYQFLLPTQATVRVLHVEINFEVGRNFAENGDNGWIYGVATEVELNPRFELVGELFTSRVRSQPAELIINAGSRLKLTPQISLLVSAGRTVSTPPGDPPHIRIYAGIQINLPNQRSQ